MTGLTKCDLRDIIKTCCSWGYDIFCVNDSDDYYSQFWITFTGSVKTSSDQTRPKLIVSLKPDSWIEKVFV